MGAFEGGGRAQWLRAWQATQPETQELGLVLPLTSLVEGRADLVLKQEKLALEQGCKSSLPIPTRSCGEISMRQPLPTAWLGR